MMLSGSVLVDETADQPGTAETINREPDSFRAPSALNLDPPSSAASTIGYSERHDRSVV